MPFPSTTPSPRLRFVMANFDAVQQRVQNSATGHTNEYATAVGNESFSAPSGADLTFPWVSSDDGGALQTALNFNPTLNGYTIFIVGTTGADTPFFESAFRASTLDHDGLVIAWDGASSPALHQQGDLAPTLFNGVQDSTPYILSVYVPNGSRATRERGAYVNGALVDHEAPTAFDSSTTAFAIGAWYRTDLSAWVQFFEGSMREVALFEGLLSATDLQAVHSYYSSTYGIGLDSNDGLPPALPSTAPPRASLNLGCGIGF